MKMTFFLVAISLLLTSCAGVEILNKSVEASGPDITATIEAQKVTEIDANQAIMVNYSVGTPVSVKYTAPESLTPYLQITCDNGKLKCKYQDGVNTKLNGREVIVDVTAPDVSDFDASSAAKIKVSGPLTSDKLEIDASSSASVIIATATANSTDIETSSAASVIISKLTTKSVDIDTSSSGNVNIDGTLGKVDVDASSAASVVIGGTCKVLNVDASSAASVNASKAKISTGTLDASSAASITVTEATDNPYKTDKSSGAHIHIR